MSLITTDSSNYESIANAIRSIDNSEEKIAPADMAVSINKIGQTYEPISNLASKGSETLPVYFDENGVATPISSYEGNSNTATKLETPINITVGNATKQFDGTSDISFSKSEAGILTASVDEDGVLSIM